MKDLVIRFLVVGLVVSSLVAVGCSSTPPAAPPTAAPAAPTKAAEATKAQVAPTSAPAQPTAVPKVAYPAKGSSITLIAPVAAGGGGDIAARTLAAQMEKELGVSIQVVNKPGASTQTGVTEITAAKPDGLTLGQIVGSTAMTYLDAGRKATYNRKSFQLVGPMPFDYNVMAVKANSPYKNLKDLVDAAKANPGKITVGDVGLMSIPNLGTYALEASAGVKFAQVHLDSSGAVTQMLGGHTEVSVTAGTAVLPSATAGESRIIALLADQPSKFYPGVKTALEQGYKVVVPSIQLLVVPAGTPKEIVDVLAQANKKALESKELITKSDELKMYINYMTPAESEKYWDNWEATVKPLIEAAKKQ